MPLPTVIADLNTTASLNYPAGTDSPAVLDDVQRAHAAFIAQLRDRTAADWPNTPAGNIAATNVQAALNELDAEKAKIGANTDITSLSGLTTPLSIAQGGTASATASAARAALGAAASGANADIASLAPNIIIGSGPNPNNRTLYINKGSTGDSYLSVTNTVDSAAEMVLGVSSTSQEAQLLSFGFKFTLYVGGSPRLSYSTSGGLSTWAGNSLQPTFGCRCFGSFNCATATMIGPGGNVGSVTRVSTGVFDVTFASVLFTAGYAVQLTSGDSISKVMSMTVVYQTVSGFRFNVSNASGSLVEPTLVNFSVFL